MNDDGNGVHDAPREEQDLVETPPRPRLELSEVVIGLPGASRVYARRKRQHLTNILGSLAARP
ncbi:MAG: hypothetical protein IE922_01120 [Sphingomonadales bacterium]|nr:hypothetical protein [Sphingomonadales bacterium]